MRNIKVPKPIVLKNPVTDEDMLDEKGRPRVVPFREFIMFVPLADPTWLSSIENVESGVKIAKLVKVFTEGLLPIEDGDFDKLKKTLEKPTTGQLAGFNPQVMGQLLEFFDAVREAEKAPEAAPAK